MLIQNMLQLFHVARLGSKGVRRQRGVWGCGQARRSPHMCCMDPETLPRADSESTIKATTLLFSSPPIKNILLILASGSKHGFKCSEKTRWKASVFLDPFYSHSKSPRQNAEPDLSEQISFTQTQAMRRRFTDR